MFAKKKIVLNSAVNDNKKGVALITCLDSLTNLQIKINSFLQKYNASYVFLLKNNGIQQRFLVDDPRNFECEVDIPIDLDKKISCLLIENGTLPIFWGGTQTRTQTMNNFDIESEHKNNEHAHFEQQEINCAHSKIPNNTQKDKIVMSNSSNNAIDNEISNIDVPNAPQSNDISDFDTHKANIQNSNFKQNNVFDKPKQDNDTSFDILYGTNFCKKAQNENIEYHKEQQGVNVNQSPNSQLQLHKVDPQEALFADNDIGQEIDAVMQYELLSDREPNTPQCANCKYKEIFFREKRMAEAKEQLQKIVELQNAEQSQGDDCTNISDVEGGISTTSPVSQDDENFCQSCTAVASSSFMPTTSQNANEEIDNSPPKKNNESEPTEKEKDDSPYYYGLIKTQYEEMFQKYPAFERLTTIIDNSKWIIVDSEDPYIMGIIYQENIPQYLCYGVIQEKKHTPPIEIMDSSQWVPFELDNEFGAGAYIMYQSAESGETLKVEIS